MVSIKYEKKRTENKKYLSRGMSIIEYVSVN